MELLNLQGKWEHASTLITGDFWNTVCPQLEEADHMWISKMLPGLSEFISTSILYFQRWKHQVVLWVYKSSLNRQQNKNQVSNNNQTEIP